MSLLSNLQTLITDVGTTVKNIRTSISGTGTNDAAAVSAALDTTATNLVDAINEVHGELDTSVGSSVTSVNGQSGPGAVTISTTDIGEGTNLYFTDARAEGAIIGAFVSGAGTVANTDTIAAAISKLDGNVLANDADIATNAADIATNAADIAAIDLTDLIDDAATATTTTWSSTKIDTEIVSAISDLKAGVGTAYDTLVEIETKFGTVDTDVTGLLTAVGNRVRFDAAQTLSVGQKNQVFTNLNLGSGIDTHDFAADFASAIA